MADTLTGFTPDLEEPGALFAWPGTWVDMTRWHQRAAEVRRTTPILEVDFETHERFWVLTRHADLLAISRDGAHWHNTTRSVLMPDAEWEAMLGTGMPEPRTLVHLDGEEHFDHRQIAAPYFKPASVGSRQPRIDELAEMFIEKMRSMGGACDFARDIAQPFTLRVIMEIYGVPAEDEPLMLDLTQGLFGAADPEYLGDADNAMERGLASIFQLIEYFNTVTEDRRAHPRDDLASYIANGEVKGCPMGDAERLWYYIIVATAGHDTTSFALSGGMEALLTHPDQLAELQAHPEIVNNGVDEILRWTSPVRHFLRYATEPTTLYGVEIPAGGRVLLSYPAANRDETVFADPDTLDVRRHNADKLITFGMGVHFCLGAQFAKRELRTMLGKLLPQLERIEQSGPAEWAQSHFVSGVKHLPVEYAFR